MSVMKFPELMDHKMPTLMTVTSFAIYRCSALVVEHTIAY